MCGIFSYLGPKNSTELTITGLKRLEYRGYDSWGIAKINNSTIKVHKQVGELGNPKDHSRLKESNVCIGHTRWATHGGITKQNAHPHFSSDKSFALAQNGIVENYSELKKQLQKSGYKFKTQTDTEVIVRLIERNLKNSKNLTKAVTKTFNELDGRNTFIVLDKNANIYTAKMGSPLVIGFTDNPDEIFFSSDTYSFAPWVNKIIVIENGQIATYISNKLKILDSKTGKEIKPKVEKLNIKSTEVDKEGFDHFMMKEIFESPYVIQQVINQDKNELVEFANQIKKSEKFYCIGSGTAGIAAAQTAYFLRKHAKVNAVRLIGAESIDYLDLLNGNDLLYAPSQSGETADVLEILELAKEKDIKIASYVNMLGSSMTRLSDFGFLAKAGPEICVMSTKVFVSQIAFGYLVAKTAQGKYDQGIQNLKKLKKLMQKYLDNKQNLNELKNLAKYLSKKEHIFLLAKGQNLQIANEAMIKIIEGSYKHAHSIAAGDLKHFAITLMEKGVDVVFVISDEEFNDVVNAANEVKARGAKTIAFSNKSHEGFDELIQIPDADEVDSIINIIPLQILAYFMAVELGNNVDKPRNIAKSVTVK